MKAIALNIGLQGTTFDRALCAAMPLFKTAYTQRTVAPTGEETLVICGEPKNTYLFPDVYALAEELQQDCIAVWFYEHPIYKTLGSDIRRGGGTLWGPRAGYWGTFKPELFVFPPRGIAECFG